MRRINYKSDIPPLLLSLKVDGKQITVPDCDFIVRFYIEGYEGRHYDCSHIGGVWSNCEPSEEGTKLVCYINNQRLGIGELCAEFHYISHDSRYSDGSKKSVVIIGSTELGVELVEDNGDAVTEAAIDVTLPFIYRTAYEIARDHGYTGTAEDFYSALASVVGIADAEKKRVTAEITRNANEQERIENEENRLNAENERVNAEAQRVRNEAIRGDAESDRVEQEEDRKATFKEITEFIATVRANEGNRESNELERQTNEDTRITEEAKRVAAEKKRAAEFEQQKLDLGGKIDRSGDEMGGDLIFTDNAGVTFRTSDGGAHTMFNDTDDVAKFTADNGDTFEFKQNETPNKASSAIVVSANLYNALDMTLDSMGSALDGDAAYRAEAGDKIFNPDTCKIQIYNSTIGGFEDLCDPIEGKLYANKLTGYIYRWDTKTKKMVFVGGVKAYTKEEADSRFAKLDDATQRVNVKELNANNFVSTKSMWIGDEGLLLGGDGNGHLTVEQDEVITDVTLNGKLATKADDVAYGVEWNNGQPTGEMQETTVREATKNTTVAALFLGQSCNALEQEVEKKANKTELDTINANVDQKVSKTDIVQKTGQSTTAVMSQKAVSNIVDELESQVIYDVTANNSGATFDSLSALLSNENLSTLIPTSVRHGGISIRFIQGSEQSSDNKYVQYRLMSDSFNTDVANWQGIDEKPTAGSDNLVKSGGVYDEISQLGQELNNNIKYDTGQGNTFTIDNILLDTAFIRMNTGSDTVGTVVVSSGLKTYKIYYYQAQTDIRVHAIRNNKPSTGSDVFAIVDDISNIQDGSQIYNIIGNGKVTPFETTFDVKEGQYIIIGISGNGITTFNFVNYTQLINVVHQNSDDIEDLHDDTESLESEVNFIENALLGNYQEIAKSQIHTGKYLGNDGLLHDINNWLVYEYAVSQYKKYRIHSYVYGQKVAFSFLDGNGNVLLKVKGQGSSSTTFDAIANTPANAVKLYVQGFNQGTNVTPKVEKYTITIYETRWNNQKWSAIGDSITEKNQTTSKNYCDYIHENSGIEVVNLGVSGTGYVRNISSNSTFYHRLSQVPSNTTVITIFGSGNDKGELPIGEITDIGETTICGWMNKTIDRAIELFPTIPLGVITPTPWCDNAPNDTGGSSSIFREYCEKLVQICARKSIPCLDLYHCSNLHPTNPECRDVTYSKDNVVKKYVGSNPPSYAILITAENIDYYQAHSDDTLAIGDYVLVQGGVHPDETGHKLIASKIKAFLDTLII